MTLETYGGVDVSIFDTFNFSTLWSPYFLTIIIAATLLYFYMIKSFQKKWETAEALTMNEIVLTITAVVLIYITKGSPLDVMSHIMFSAHMTQMAILYLVVPILIIRGVPDWVWSKLLLNGKLSGVFRLFTKAIIAIFLFNIIFSFYHIPLIFDVVKSDIWLHGIYNFVLFILAFFMWWPLMNTVQEKPLSGLQKVGYLFANSVLLTPACALIIFADAPMYLTYTDPSFWAKAMELCLPAGASLADLGISGPELFNTMPLLDDQQLGGVLMKILQEIIFGVVLAMIFFNWYKQDQEEQAEHDRLNFEPKYVE